MLRNGSPVIGFLLLGGIALAGVIFGLANWHWLEQQQLLEHEGIVAVARIDAVTISHKACNSTVVLRWADSSERNHRDKFATCFANRLAGESMGIRYLSADPDTAMIAAGEGGLPDDHYRTGVLIGAIVAAVMGAATISLALQRSRAA